MCVYPLFLSVFSRCVMFSFFIHSLCCLTKEKAEIVKDNSTALSYKHSPLKHNFMHDNFIMCKIFEAIQVASYSHFKNMPIHEKYLAHAFSQKMALKSPQIFITFSDVY